MVNYSAMWLLLSIYMVWTVLVCQKADGYFTVALQMKTVVTVPEDVAGKFRTYLPIKTATTLFMDACD